MIERKGPHHLSRGPEVPSGWWNPDGLGPSWTATLTVTVQDTAFLRTLRCIRLHALLLLCTGCLLDVLSQCVDSQ